MLQYLKPGKPVVIDTSTRTQKGKMLFHTGGIAYCNTAPQAGFPPLTVTLSKMQPPEPQEQEFYSLAWEGHFICSDPIWTVEPDIGDIEQTVRSLRPSSTVEVTFLTQGGFNKIYNISIDDDLSCESHCPSTRVTKS